MVIVHLITFLNIMNFTHVIFNTTRINRGLMV